MGPVVRRIYYNTKQYAKANSKVGQVEVFFELELLRLTMGRAKTLAHN